MSSDYENPSLIALAARWWMLVARGVAAILFGVLAIAAPRISLFALVILWGVYAIADGVFNLMLAARGAGAERSWRWLLGEGIVSLLAGVATFVWPGITALVLLSVIAFWAVFTGIAEIVAAIQLRRAIQGEWMLAVSGILSVVFGSLLLVFPGAGALALVAVIGAYAIAFGALLIGLGVRLHRLGPSGERPFAGTPRHA